MKVLKEMRNENVNIDIDKDKRYLNLRTQLVEDQDKLLYIRDTYTGINCDFKQVNDVPYHGTVD